MVFSFTIHFTLLQDCPFLKTTSPAEGQCDEDNLGSAECSEYPDSVQLGTRTTQVPGKVS